MSEFDKIEVNRYGEGDSECIMFDLYNNSGNTSGVPDYCFYVYVNTGKCEAGPPTGSWYEFDADDCYRIS